MAAIAAQGTLLSTSLIESNDDNITVEEFLTAQCDTIISDLQEHGTLLIKKLREEYAEGVADIKQTLAQNCITSMKLCVTLKCIAGGHLGQKFRLEPTTDNGEDVFKMGRSTGRLFREKGVSLYKDKEISTTHAKIELRNGQVFLVDAASTNGTQINGGNDIEPHAPHMLREGDIITMGSTELLVGISDMDDQENIGHL